MSYFPTDIPFMSDEEMRENGIRIPGDVTDTNVGNIEYISKQAAIEAIANEVEPFVIVEPGTTCVIGAGVKDADVFSKLESLPSADVVPYSIAPDGTLTITVPKGTYEKINRVLVEEEGTQWGGLFYAD